MRRAPHPRRPRPPRRGVGAAAGGGIGALPSARTSDASATEPVNGGARPSSNPSSRVVRPSSPPDAGKVRPPMSAKPSDGAKRSPESRSAIATSTSEAAMPRGVADALDATENSADRVRASGPRASDRGPTPPTASVRSSASPEVRTSSRRVRRVRDEGGLGLGSGAAGEDGPSGRSIAVSAPASQVTAADRRAARRVADVDPPGAASRAPAGGEDRPPRRRPGGPRGRLPRAARTRWARAGRPTPPCGPLSRGARRPMGLGDPRHRRPCPSASGGPSRADGAFDHEDPRGAPGPRAGRNGSTPRAARCARPSDRSPPRPRCGREGAEEGAVRAASRSTIPAL